MNKIYFKIIFQENNLTNSHLCIGCFIVEFTSDIDVSWVQEQHFTNLFHQFQMAVIQCEICNVEYKFIQALHITMILTCSSSNSTARNQTTLDQLVGVVPQDLSVLTRSWFTLITVDNQISWSESSKPNIRKSKHYNHKKQFYKMQCICWSFDWWGLVMFIWISPSIIGFVHETPLHSSWKTCSTSASQSRLLHFILDPLKTFKYDLLCFVPVSLESQ